MNVLKKRLSDIGCVPCRATVSLLCDEKNARIYAVHLPITNQSGMRSAHLAFVWLLQEKGFDHLEFLPLCRGHAFFHRLEKQRGFFFREA